MKRLFPLLLILLLLCGCGGKTEPTEPVQTLSVTEPEGSYMPDSALEQFTGGAVKAYPQQIPDIFAIACAGEDVLVFSGLGNTVITRLAGVNLHPIAEVRLDDSIDPGNPSVRITEDGIVYFNRITGEMVFLDEALLEYHREKVSDDWIGDPVISADLKNVYYCTENGIRVLDLGSHRSRLIREMSYPMQSLNGLLMEDSILQCTVHNGDRGKNLFLDPENGAVLGRVDDTLTISGGRNCFYGRYLEGENVVFLVGEDPQTIRMLTPENDQQEDVILPAVNGLLTISEEEEQKALTFYDFTSGTKDAEVHIPSDIAPYRYGEDPWNRRIYFLAHGDAESTILCRWDMAESPCSDETVYTVPWYNEENPDLEGLLACEAYAKELSQEYGVQILIGESAAATEPWDYDLQPEYRVAETWDGLRKLDSILRHFPTDFFSKAMEGTGGGMLSISLVQSMNGNHASGSLEDANGIQFWEGSDACVAVALRDTFERTFYHEMFHVLESRILSQSDAYYRWDELNPGGFTYDYDYVVNLEREDSEWTTDDRNRVFIDTYSMSYPKEDRARIMEYACMEGNGNYFLSSVMQKKLRILCVGIREAYGVEDSPETFLWEQYLKTPLSTKE